MIPWIKIYSNICSHDKTYALSERLKIDQFAAVGIMVSLWVWVAANATDGDVSSYPPRAIATAVGWTKKAETLYQALLDAHLLEGDGEGRVVVRNWEQYASAIMSIDDRKRKKTAERVQAYRKRKSENGDNF